MRQVYSKPCSFEASARSSVCQHSPTASWRSQPVVVNVCQFGRLQRSPLLLPASSQDVFNKLDAPCSAQQHSTFQRVDEEMLRGHGLAQCVTAFLNLSDLQLVASSSQKAQVLTGLQPHKLPLRLMPEFKLVTWFSVWGHCQ